MAQGQGPARKKQIKEPTVPAERYESIRRHMAALLEQETLSARDLSQYMRIPERDVSEHLEHIRKTLARNHRRLTITPAQCDGCGFVYKKRDRFSKPGKCPVCHKSLIRPPLFHIEQMT